MTKRKKNKKGIIIAALLLLALVLFIIKPLIIAPIANKPPKKSMSTITMEPQFTKEGTLVFLNAEKDTIKLVDIEIADNEQEREQGMMYRTSMSYDRAMLFIMQYEREQSFWMHNTKMSLDIIYVNGDMEIVTIYKHTQPYSESPIPSFKRAKYVVETTAGFCDKFRIAEGDYIEFSSIN